jgi:hypothetical protein
VVSDSQRVIVIKVTIVRVVRSGDLNLRFAPYEEIILWTKLYFMALTCKLCNLHGYIHTSNSPSSFKWDMRVRLEESAADVISLYVYGIYIMLVMNLNSKPR